MVSGSVRVILFSSAGKEVAFRDIPAGECFGEYAAIDGAPRSANVIALTDVMIGSVSAETFRSILQEYPAVSMALLTSLIRSEEHTSELQSLMRISYAVFCLKKKKKLIQNPNVTTTTQ